VVHAFYIHIKDSIPLGRIHLTHKAKVGNARIADENVCRSDLLESSIHGLPAGHITANGGGTGLQSDSLGGCMIFFVQEKYPVSTACKEPDCRSANATGATGDHNRCHSVLSDYLLRLLVRWSEY